MDWKRITSYPRLRMALGQASGRTARAVAVLLLLVAGYVSAGRLLMPLVETQRAEIESALGEALGVPVEIASLRGSWRGFSPQVEVAGLVIHNADEGAEGPGLRVAEGVVQLDVPESLWRKAWVVGSVRLRSISLEAVQEASGRWRLAGLQLREPRALGRLLDLLLNTSRLDLEDVRLLLRPHGLPALQLSALRGQLRNEQERHRLWLEARPGAGLAPWQLRLDLEGDPRGRFQGEAWAQLGLDSLLPLLEPLELQGLRPDGLSGQLRLWAGLGEEGLQRVQGRLIGAALTAALPGGTTLNLDQAATTFTALRQSPDEWRLWLQDFGFRLDGRSWPAADLHLRWDGHDGRRLVHLAAQRAELGVLAAGARLAGLLPERAQAALDDLEPRGSLSNLRLDLDLDRPADFRLRANLAGVAVQAWQAAPAGSGIRGYVEAGARAGFVEVDAQDFSLHLPRLFPQPWHYERVNARVHWALEDEGFTVSSSPIAVSNAELDGRVQFELLGRRGTEGRWRSELALLVGVTRMEASAKSLYLPRLQSLARTMTWLDTAIRDGRLHDSGFLFRGATRRGELPNQITTQSFYRFEDVELEYLPDWPRLERAEGFVQVADARAELRADSGEVAGLRLRPVQGLLDRAAEGGFWLDIEGGADADSGTGLDFLRDSPLREPLGDFLTDWRAEGGLDIDLQLRVPLGVPERKPEVQVDVSTGNSRLDLGSLGLVFENLAGTVHYATNGGLSSPGLNARLFGRPVDLGIESFPEEAAPERPLTRVSAAGRVAAEDLRVWTDGNGELADLLPRASGEFDYEADFSLYRDAGGATRSRLQLVSDLEGLALDLPEPFAKAADTERELQLGLDFLDGGQRVAARLGDEFSANLELSGGSLARGLVHFGPLNRDFSIRESGREEKGLLVTGELERLDLQAWRALAETWSPEAAGEGSAQDGEQSGLAHANLRLLDLRVGELLAAGATLHDLNVQVSPTTGAGWRMFVDNAVLRGEILTPAVSRQPWRITLDHLRLPAREAAATEGTAKRPDPLQAVDPRQLPALEFSTGELSVGSNLLGAWSLRLRPQAGGLRVENLQAALPGGLIEGLEQGSGARLDWRYAEAGGHSTRFSGRLRAGDLAQLLPALGYGATLQSRAASFAGELVWPGSPAAFALSRSSGEMELRIENGRFVDVDTGGARLLGALNFDAVVRRLQLDFSDLFGRGYAYDSIGGWLDLEDGIVSTSGPLRIEGPSSEIDVSGSIDLPRQTIDADLLVRLPLSENLSVLAGLLGAWPVAVGTYVAGKIFEEQVADITSVVYRLEGPWNDLDANFEVPAGSAEAEAAAAEEAENPAPPDTARAPVPQEPARPAAR